MEIVWPWVLLSLIVHTPLPLRRNLLHNYFFMLHSVAGLNFPPSDTANHAPQPLASVAWLLS